MIAAQARWAALAIAASGLAALMSCTGSEAASKEVAEPLANDAGAEAASEPLADSDGADRRAGFAVAGALAQGGWIRGRAPGGASAVLLGDRQLELAQDGSFFAAFDRDSPASLTLRAEGPNGIITAQTLAIAPRQWDIERVNIARSPGGMTDAFWQIRKPELDAINAARARVTGASGWQQDFIWPVKGRISGRFGRQRIYRGEPGAYHSGLDIAPGAGVPFVAPADGVVVLARSGFSLEGGLIIIDHGHGLNSAFLHASRIVVSEGQSVRQGEHIGNVGATGRATGPHLHWGLKWNDARLDPLLFVGPMN